MYTINRILTYTYSNIYIYNYVCNVIYDTYNIYIIRYRIVYCLYSYIKFLKYLNSFVLKENWLNYSGPGFLYDGLNDKNSVNFSCFCTFHKKKEKNC